MARSETINKLVEISEERMREIANELGAVQEQIQQATHKLDVLQGYAREYQERLNRALGAGLSGAQSRAYLAFLDQLDNAIELQSSALETHQHQLSSLRERWLASRRQKLAYETLKVRLDTEAERKALAEMQKQMDDFAQRARESVFALG